MSSFTLPPNLELALRKEKDELEFHTDKYSTCLAKIEDSTEVKEEARSEELIKAFTKLAIKFSQTEKYVILNSSLQCFPSKVPISRLGPDQDQCPSKVGRL